MQQRIKTENFPLSISSYMLKTQSPKLICDTRPSIDQASYPCFLKSKLCPSSSPKNLALLISGSTQSNAFAIYH